MNKYKDIISKYKYITIYVLSIITAALLGAYFTSTSEAVSTDCTSNYTKNGIVNKDGIVYELVKPIRDVYSINVFTKDGNIYCDVPMEQYYTIAQGDLVNIKLIEDRCVALTNLTQVIPVEPSDLIG